MELLESYPLYFVLLFYLFFVLCANICATSLFGHLVCVTYSLGDMLDNSSGMHTYRTVIMLEYNISVMYIYIYLTTLT